MGASYWIFMFAAYPFLTEGVSAFQRQDMGFNLVARQANSSSSSISSTIPSSSSVPTAGVGATPVLFFNDIDNATVCSSTLITWNYAGPPINMTLTVTNVGVQQVPLPPAPSTFPSITTIPRTYTNAARAAPTGATNPDVTVTLSTRVNPLTLAFTWPIVNVTSGSYQLYASISSQDFLKSSAVFYVLQGSDSSCLPTSTSSPSSSSASTQTMIPFPVSGSGKSLHAGAIIGIILGVLFVVVVMIAVYFFLRRNEKRTRPSSGSRSKKGGFGFSQGWNGLTSTDSGATLNNQFNPPATVRSGHHHSHLGSRGVMLTPESEEVIGGSPSEEKLGNIGYGRKNSFGTSYDDHNLALATLPTLHHQSDDFLWNGVGRTYSTSTAHSFSANDLASPGDRRPSYADSTTGVGKRASMDSSSHHFANNPAAFNMQESSQLVRSPSLGTSATHQTTTAVGNQLTSSASPISPPQSPDMKKVNRASLGARKTSRKPVPTYELHDVSPSPIPFMPSPSPVPQSINDHDTLEGQMGGSGSNLGHYLTRNNSNHSSRPTTGDHELVHKSSFGPGGVEGKQLHYLIPDMPVHANW